MSRKWWVLAAVACGTFMATLDSSIVNIALPTLTKVFGTDVDRVKWVVIVYVLVITCLLLIFGRLSDQYGRRRIFQWGFVVFTVGSAFCSFSTGLIPLILARALQAVGASMLMANGPALITAAFPASERGTALGTMAMVVSAGLISGPGVGGLLISSFGWRSIFILNLPVGIVGLLLVNRNVARDHGLRNPAPFDWAGAILQTILLLSLIVLFDPLNVSVSGSMPFPISRWFMAAVVLAVGTIFVKVESDAKAPLLDLSLLKNRTFWSANVAGFLTFVWLSSVSILMPYFFEDVMHFPTHTSGMFMTAIPLTILVIAPISGRLSDTFGSRGLSFAGALIGALSLLIMSGILGPGIGAQFSSFEIIVLLVTIGLAIGLFQSPNNNAIMGSVPSSKLGVASALLATIRNLGLAIGTSLSMGLFSWRMKETGDFVHSLHFTHFIAAIIAVCAMLAALIKRDEPRKSFG
jgi:EmrB/QacA subfamily drug resistance transporter